MKMIDIVKLIAVVIGAGVLANFIGFGASAGILGGIALIALGVTAYGKKLGINKDMHKGVVVLVGVLLIFSVPVLSDPYNQAVGAVTGLFSGIAPVSGNVDTGAGAGASNAGQQGGGQSIITTTASLTINVENLLNKTRDALNPSGFYSLDGTSYTALSFTSGKATVSSLDPFATIPRVAVGTDGTFYWDIEDNVAIKGSLSPVLTMYVVRVPSATSPQLFGTTYTELTDGKNNVTVGSGGNQKGFFRFEVTSAVTGLRHPIIATEYNTSAVSGITMGGLTKVACPSRIVTTSTNPVNSLNGLQECFDTGADWFVSSDSKAGIPNTIYGFKDFQYTVDYVSGVNPSDAGAGGNNVVFYVIDQDKFYRNANANTLFALDPELGTIDLGYTTEPDAYLGVA